MLLAGCGDGPPAKGGKAIKVRLVRLANPALQEPRNGDPHERN